MFTIALVFENKHHGHNDQHDLATSQTSYWTPIRRLTIKFSLSNQKERKNGISPSFTVSLLQKERMGFLLHLLSHLFRMIDNTGHFLGVTLQDGHDLLCVLVKDHSILVVASCDNP